MRSGRAALAAAVVLQTLFAWSVLWGLGTPLLWHDEGDTAMFGRRILEYGYPVVHADGNIVYGVAHPLELGVHEPLDAYLGSPWGQYYYAAPAVAWSDRAEGLAERTRRLRLPFALAGLVGVGLLFAAGLPLLPGGRPERALYWALSGLLACASVSLQLHLREARYYGPVILALGAIAWALSRRFLRRDFPGLPYTLWLAPWLWWTSTLFYPAFLSLLCSAAVLGLGSPRRGLREGAPFALAAVAAAPLWFFFDVPAQGLAFLERFGQVEGIYWDRLADVLLHLLRYEFAAAAAVGSLALWWGERGGTRIRVIAAVWIFVASWALWVARTPFFYERYCVMLSPLLIALCAGSWVALARSRAKRRLLALSLVGVASLALRAPELGGRVSELTGEPYRGPLDHVIPYLAEHYPDIGERVIATNYEGPVYMFYLGAITTLGFYAPELERDRAMAPDLIVPRPWGVNLPELSELAAEGEFEPRVFPVANLRANNVPMLSPRNQAGLAHRFASPRAGKDGAPLVILERRPAPQPTDGASSDGDD